LMVGCLLMSDSNFGVSFDLPGTHELSYDGSSLASYDSNMGFGVFSEFYTPMSKSSGVNFEGGFGVAYLFPRGIDIPDWESSTVSYIPLYLLGRLVTSGSNGPSLYGNVKFGYDLMYGNDDYSGDTDLNGGLFMGFGGGVIFQSNMFFELSYQILNGGFDFASDTIDIKQTNLSILIGVRTK